MTKVRIDYTPRPWQRKCHLSRKRFTVLALHRRAGKTELAIMELLDKAMQCTSPLGMFVYLAPLLKQAESVVWARLKQKMQPLVLAGAADVHEGDLTVTFKHNGAMVRLFGANNPDAIRGMRLDGVVIDEVAQIQPYVWDDIVQPALSDRLGWAVFIGTPHGVNLFSELFYKGGQTENWFAAKFTVYDTNSLDKDEVERLRREMPEHSFAREYLCDFAAAGDDQLIPLTDVEAAARRVYGEGDIAMSPRIMGVDPARFGDDRSVIVKRQGLQVLPALVFRGMDNMELAGRVAAEIHSWCPDAVFIDSGAGAGVIDRLRQLGFHVVEVPFGGKANEPTRFINRRTEMWFGLREWIMAGGAIPNDTALKQELATPIYWFDAQGRHVLEPKDEIKKRLQGGASPDIADGVALTFAHPVIKHTPMEREQQKARSQTRDYNPYAKRPS